MSTIIIGFNEYNLFRRIADYKEYQKLKKEKEYFQNQIIEVERVRTELFSSEEKMEKFAREKYNMKKDNEDVFILKENKN